MSNSQKSINQTCEYRGLPFIPKGAVCTVDGEKGQIWGGNHSGNFNVKFENGQIGNCHPEWKMQIYNPDGSILHDSEAMGEGPLSDDWDDDSWMFDGSGMVGDD